MSDKSLLEQWRATAYDQSLSKTELENFWRRYLCRTFKESRRRGSWNFKRGGSKIWTGCYDNGWILGWNQ